MNPPRKIIIVGGGTAGWMTASIFLHAWKHQGISITLVESEEIGTIGVGEGSTPALRKFFSYLRIAEKDWMPECNATYKAGIFFDQWSCTPGYESYFHPFYSAWDEQGARTFVENANKKRQCSESNAHPNSYFLGWHLANANKAPLPIDNQLGNRVDYGYHFDANLLGKFLSKRAEANGLTHIIDNVIDVTLNTHDEIASITTKKNGILDGDFFVDCTGFASLLINKTLKEPFISFKENLFNDSAVTLPTNMGDVIPSATRSTALQYGWAWQIPLTNRYGNGYVYSSDFISADQAEHELRNHLGINNQNINARHLKMRIGRIENHWKGNCLAVGLSQGFIEPLEATALAIVQSTLENFVDCFDRPINTKIKQNFNNYINNLIEGIRDYIVTHYLLNTRKDTAYWISCREQAKPSRDLQALIDRWDSDQDFLEILHQQERAKVYKPESWFCIFAGMGRFKTFTHSDKQSSMKIEEKLIKIMNTHFMDHRERLAL